MFAKTIADSGLWAPFMAGHNGLLVMLMLALAGGGLISAAPAQSDENVIEEVVVTGSYIRGTPEDAALPVDVIDRSDLEVVGAPSINEIIRNLNVSSGTLSETNQFDDRGGQSNGGVSTVNLRGLGPARTLVLLNSKRHVTTESQGVDISAIPTIALRRLEVLKDGAAATYGSDAIGGVVNLLTRSNFQGFEAQLSHQIIEGSSGDQNMSFIIGDSVGRANWTLAAELSQRGELGVKDRDWGLRPFAENPAPGGWSSIGNPGTMFPAVSNGNGGLASGVLGTVADPNCDALGGALIDEFCRFQYTFFANLIEEEDSKRVFGEVNMDLSDNVQFHAEMLWHEMDMNWKTSPSFPPQALLGPDRFVDADHPGLIALKAANPELFADEAALAGVGIDQLGVISWSRMLGVTGRNGEAEARQRVTETLRFSTGLKGAMTNGIGFDVSLSYSERKRDVYSSDMYVERMAFALDGLAGEGCDPSTGAPGEGPCEYYNPFSNAFPTSAVLGIDNLFYDASVANSDELIDYLTASPATFSTNEQLVLEAIFNGDTALELQGGAVGWAAGLQFRQEDYDFSVTDEANRALNPCPFNDPYSVTIGNVASLDCGDQRTGLTAFLAATDEENTDRSIYGIFAEINVPFTDAMEAQLAFRYEDYGDDGSSSFDPKLSLRWSPTDSLTFRGSASTTFRGPPASFLSGTSTTLKFIAPARAFKALDTVGNVNLEPEEATTVNVGMIYQTGGFFGSIDYWSFDFSNPFQIENVDQIVAAYDAAGCADGSTGVDSDACTVLRARLTPMGTPVAGVQRVERYVINGSDVTTSGLDVAARYTREGAMNGTLELGIKGSYQLEYESDDFLSLEGLTLGAGGDFVGFSNEGTPFTPLPDYKTNAYVRWSNDQHSIGWTVRRASGYEDRTADTPANLRKIDSFMTHDITYVNTVNENLTASLSIYNATDEDPPQVANDLNYDAYNHNPFGRMVKIGLTYSME